LKENLNLAEISHKSKDLVNLRAAKARKASWDCQQATLVFLRLHTSPLFGPCCSSDKTNGTAFICHFQGFFKDFWHDLF